MQLKQLLNDDDAVSPVIGVILMVAITVILAAVIGTFVLGLGDQVQETSPNAQWSWEQTDISGDVQYGTYQATIRQDGGQDVDPSALALQLDSENATTTYAVDDSANWNGLDSDGDIVAGANYDVVDPVTDGDQNDGIALDSGDEVRLLWTSSEGGTSSTLTVKEVS